jgi:3-oxoacyl-[acyl-carrier-protein] synthase II
MTQYLELKRVVVTGLGTINSIGSTINEFWQNLIQGRSGVDKITHFDASNHSCKIAAEVKNFEPLDYFDQKAIKRMDRFVQFAIYSSQQAILDANFTINELNAEHVGVIIGSAMGGIKTTQEQQNICMSKGSQFCSPFTIPMIITNMASGLTAIQVGAKGPNSCPATSCTAASHAIGDAFRLVQRGDAQAMLCGGAEAAITELGIAGFASAKALSTRNDQPKFASRPFDAERNGFVMGEGAGILLLEELEHAKSRRAKIYAEIVGYGMTCDAYHITSPIPGGLQAARAMTLALKDASLTPEQVSYINAHGTSTKANDSTETAAIKTALKDHAYQVAVSSTKSMTGHLLGASGGIEAIASILSIANNQIHPTINLNNPDPECDLDYVPHQSRSREVNVALSNSYAFGGHNVTLAFKKYLS